MWLPVMSSDLMRELCVPAVGGTHVHARSSKRSHHLATEEEKREVCGGRPGDL